MIVCALCGKEITEDYFHVNELINGEFEEHNYHNGCLFPPLPYTVGNITISRNEHPEPIKHITSITGKGWTNK